MASYYTWGNFITYAVSITALLLLVPLAVISGNKRSGKVVLSALCLLSLGAAAFPLSRTCPYPDIAYTLVFLSHGFLSSGSLLAVFIIARRLLQQFRHDVPVLYPEDADRWITHMVRDSYLVLDSGGRIIAGGLSGLTDSSPKAGTAFEDFLSEVKRQNNPEGLDTLRKAFAAGRNTESHVAFEGYYGRWRLQRLGTKGGDGYLFTLLDLSEEKALISVQEEQQRLLEIRNARLRDQGLRAAESERSGASARLAAEYTALITESLKEFDLALTELDTAASLNEAAIDRALESGAKTMASVRAVVHAIPVKGDKVS